MLLAALDLPFSDSLHDTRQFTTRVESEIAAKEFDVLVLPAQPYPSSANAPWESPHALISWLCTISHRKHALIVCGTSEWTTKSSLHRTALAAYDGQLVARHVMYPHPRPKRIRSARKIFTLVDTPVFSAAILLEEELTSSLSLTALSAVRVSTCLVSSQIPDKSPSDIATHLAARFGVFVVLAGYAGNGSDKTRSGSAIASPTGHLIAERHGADALLVADVPDVPGWVATADRESHLWALRATTSLDDWVVWPNPLRDEDGFYVPRGPSD